MRAVQIAELIREKTGDGKIAIASAGEIVEHGFFTVRRYLKHDAAAVGTDTALYSTAASRAIDISRSVNDGAALRRIAAVATSGTKSIEHFFGAVRLELEDSAAPYIRFVAKIFAI